MAAAYAQLSRTPSVFVPTTVRLSEKHRLLLEEQMLASKRRSPQPPLSSTKRTHRFLGELAVRPVTTLKVVGTPYHTDDPNTMAKRKIRAFYRQFFGTLTDIVTGR